MVRFSTTALTVALALSSTAAAFAPSSSFVGNARPFAAFSVPSSTSALQMNLFDRFTRVVKSNANEILKNLEDPEKIMNQALEDMQVCSEEAARIGLVASG